MNNRCEICGDKLDSTYLTAQRICSGCKFADWLPEFYAKHECYAKADQLAHRNATELPPTGILALDRAGNRVVDVAVLMSEGEIKHIRRIERMTGLESQMKELKK